MWFSIETRAKGEGDGGRGVTYRYRGYVARVSKLVRIKETNDPYKSNAFKK